MAKISTLRKAWENSIRKAYFNYWRLQNNPEYIKFWEKVKSLGDKAYQKYIFNPPLKEGENYTEWRLRTNWEGEYKSWLVENMRKFGVWEPLPDPYKKIDWKNFIKNPDKEIIDSMNNVYCYNADSKRRFAVKIDPMEDDWEILHKVKITINFYRAWMATRGIFKPTKKEHLEKFPLYAQVWDLRKSPGRKSFQEIAKIMKRKPSTVKMMFYKAFELIFGKPYDPDFFKDYKSKIPKRSLEKCCDTCEERKTCKEPCSIIIPYIMQDWKEKNYREVYLRESNIKIKSHLGYSK